MELKVWCDGIQRVVCGATAATTCQDIVFALAHATGQTGRFILIEKWRNNERVLAPTDRPLTSLAKWGEYSSDVTFVLKKSGEVDSSNDNKISSISKKSDTDLLLKRKDVNHFNNQENNEKHISKSSKIKSMSSIDTSQSHSNTLPSKHKEPFVRSLSFYKSNQLESSQHRENANISSNGVGKLIDKFNSTSGGESLYGTLPNNRHRPRQPPPYKEAITKSTLVNIINTTTSPNNGSTYGYLGGFSNKTNHSSSQQSSPFASTTPHSNRTGPFNETLRKENATLKPNHNQQSPLHQETIYLIDTQQKTIKNQERNINNIEHEIDLVQKKLSENKYIVKRYQDEMELLNQLWVEQEMLIQKLESENMEQELDQLIVEGEKYEGEMKEIKSKLAECESEVMKCREEISNLMGKIEEQATINPFSVDTSCDESTLLERIEASIKDKSQELQSQKSDIETLNESIEQMDKTIEGKNSLIDQLVVEIKEANVEGLSFQSAASSGLVVEERECETAHDLTMVRSPTNRKIPVSPHELANTVPTKKNPDGIWV